MYVQEAAIYARAFPDVEREGLEADVQEALENALE